MKINKTQLCNVDDDTPLFRIFRRSHLEDAVKTSELTLVSQTKWDDPFEELLSRVKAVVRAPAWRGYYIQQWLDAVYAQCWSATEESDTLLRAYSQVRKDSTGRNAIPDAEGIRARTTVGSLRTALDTWLGSNPGWEAFIGRVEYVPEAHLKQWLGGLVLREGEKVGAADVRATVLLKKRYAFRHEDEVRVIIGGPPATTQNEMLRVGIPSNLIQEIAFDPRLAIAEQMVQRESLTKAGYLGHFHDWALYQGLLLELVMPDGWIPCTRSP